MVLNHKITFIRSIFWFSLMYIVLVLTGCATIGPDYVPPKMSVSPTWNTQLKAGLTAEILDPNTLATWWKTLKDQTLSSLIDRAVRGNLDLRKARARVREARARRGIATADLFPTLNTTGSATWSRSSKDTGEGQSSELYTAGFDAT